VASFAPVDGEATLRSFVAYLDAAEEAEETLEATQPADQDSVKLMTVHAAKGLEFECVFVPSVAASEGKGGAKVYSLFPNTRASNPLTSRTELPFEVREDADHLPRFEGKVGDFQDAVKARALEDERRLFYVALTRAKQRLAVTASWWYGRDKREKGPSQFWDELEPLAERDLLTVVRKDEKPAENPMFEAMESRREWPPPARAGTDDRLFVDGWGVAADSIVDGATTIDSLLDKLSADERTTAAALIAEHEQDLSMIAAAVTPPAPAEPDVPEIVSATRWIALQNGDVTAWDLVRPLPERPTIARRIGTEVHRLIEERNRGISPFANEHDLDEPGAHTEPSRIGQLLERWKELGYADRTLARLPSGEPMVELPFAMKKDGRIIRGRIDAVYETDDGGLEIVDWKAGSGASKPDGNQISLYVEALGQFDGDSLRLIRAAYVRLAAEERELP
jgi:DNA helicase-2/ATP-dependent DNA helicase PcrA